jgi:hypothetical protein
MDASAVDFAYQHSRVSLEIDAIIVGHLLGAPLVLRTGGRLLFAPMRTLSLDRR